MVELTDALLNDKTVLVSGGTQGLGAAVAASALRNGATVVVTGRRADVGHSLVGRLGTQFKDRIHYVPCDVADVTQLREAVAAAKRLVGRIDCLVNSAGLTTRGSILDTSVELFDQHIAVNTRAPFFLMQEAIQDMRGRGGGGSIVNVITMAAHGGQPHLAPYVASKSALVGLTRNAAHAHRWDRIRVNGLNIGWTETEGEDAVQREFHGAHDGWLADAAERLPMGKLGQTEEIADFIVFLLSDRSGVVTGSVIDWDQLIPGAWD